MERAASRSHRANSQRLDPAECNMQDTGFLGADGSAIPWRYLKGCNYNLVEAKRRWDLTCEWRKNSKIEGILEEEFPEFPIMKDAYPHFIYGYSKNGIKIYYEKICDIDLKKLKAHHISTDRLLRYYIMMTEFIYRQCDTRQNAQVITIMDLKGIGISNYFGDAKQFLSAAISLIGAHYPERCHKIFLINCDYLFTLVWKVVKMMFDPNTLAKVSLCGTNYHDELAEYLGAANIPLEYGGTNKTLLKESVEEVWLKEHIERVLKGKRGQAPINLINTKSQSLIFDYCDDRSKRTLASVNRRYYTVYGQLFNDGLPTKISNMDQYRIGI